ncbi:MAG: DNA helicase UvrD, partial [Acidimicrobiales bacterium]
MTDATSEAGPVDAAARNTVERELGRTLFVEAGAGTGKTTALVGRIVNLVLGEGGQPRVRLSKIAAITFTEAAAAELRDRVRTTFEAKQHEARQSGHRERERLCNEALEDADLAAISTLHAFAQRLLSERSIEVGVPPRVQVVDEVQSQLAFEDRWSQFVDQLYADDDIAEFIIRASILGVSVGNDRSPLRKVAKIFDDNWDRLPEQSGSSVAVPIQWAELRDAAQNVINLLPTCTADTDLLLTKVSNLRAVLELFVTDTPDLDRLRALDRLKNAKGSNGQRGNWPDVAEARATVKAMAAVAEKVHSQVANDTLQMLADRIAGFTLDTAEERRREGELEFHDLLVLARRLLRSSAEARTELSARYEVLMLDEFQDTDPIQIELALLLAGVVEGDDEGRFTGKWDELDAVDGRLFMVGDPKQSIYRFRRADIALFLAVREKFESGRVTLSQNFRTVAPVVEAVNVLFDELMPDDSPAQAKYQPLKPFRQAPADHRPLILGGPLDGTAAELRLAESEDVAAVITNIAHKPGDWPVFDTTTKQWRAPQMRDITILLPTRTSLGTLT